jgi:hypothetical protein
MALAATRPTEGCTRWQPADPTPDWDGSERADRRRGARIQAEARWGPLDNSEDSEDWAAAPGSDSVVDEEAEGWAAEDSA